MRLLLPFALLASLACAGGPKNEDTSTGPHDREGDDGGECADGADNDVDGRFDCDDADCASSPDCDDSTDTETRVDSGTTDDSGGTTVDPCAGHAPVLSNVEAAAMNGLNPDGTGEIFLSFDVSDPDEALVALTGGRWWDEVVDGTVDTSGEGVPYGPVDASSGWIGVGLGVDGKRLHWATEYEFAVTATDSDGCTSAVAVAAGVTPNSDGTAP